MTCDLCGEKGVRVRRVTRTYGRGGSLLLIKGVPVIHCPACGEAYLTSRTLHAIERIKRHRRTLALKRPVAVAEFA